MPKIFSPRLLNSEAANTAADLQLILRDLEHIKNCCEILLEEQHCLLTETKGRALLDSVAIRYRRCFTGAVRTGLKKSDFNFAIEESELHDFFLALANKHIAHSVNAFETNCTTIHIAIDETGTLHRGGLGSNGSSTVDAGLHTISEFSDLVGKVIEKTKELIKKESEIVEAEVASMTDEELKQLPDGFAPIRKVIPVDKDRKWPPRKQ